jgi:pyruvate/2-oxoglutarate dehydrogenase complex dihydrolipoamide acyltransferase (E2) component
MAYDCPHCQKSIDDVIPRARLDEKNTIIKAQDERFKKMEDQLREIETLREQAGQVGRLRDELALSRAGVHDERQARRILGAWRADSEGHEKPPTLHEWMSGDGAEFVRPFLAAPPVAQPQAEAQATPPAAAQPAPAPAAAQPPMPRDRGAAPPPPPSTGRLTPQQAEDRARPLRDEYRGASVERRVEIRRQIEAITSQVMSV